MKIVAPVQALKKGRRYLVGYVGVMGKQEGIDYLLRNSKLNIILVCHSGNHARTTRTTRFGAENGHSLEYLMYLHLAAYFR